MRLQINQISKLYNGKAVLNMRGGFIFEQGIFGILGNNGAGKTTLLNIMLDLILPDSGAILINNQNVRENESWKNFTGSYLSNESLIGFLRPEEFFVLIGSFYAMKEETVMAKLSEYKVFFNGEILNQKKLIREFSSGIQQKIGIVAAFLHDPKLLIFDEPFNFLDPSSQDWLKKYLYNYTQQKSALIFLSSHQLYHIRDLCDRVLILQSGELIKDIGQDAFDQIKDYFKSDG